MYKPDNKDIDSIVNGEKFRIRLTNEMKTWLFHEADKTGNTVSSIIREAINQYIQKHS